jgi:hypothetical protein
VLDPAVRTNWTVSNLVLPASGTGPVLGGYGEGIHVKSVAGMAVSVAVVGTMIDSYLIVAEGVISAPSSQAKADAGSVFQRVISAAG